MREERANEIKNFKMAYRTNDVKKRSFKDTKIYVDDAIEILSKELEGKLKMTIFMNELIKDVEKKKMPFLKGFSVQFENEYVQYLKK